MALLEFKEKYQVSSSNQVTISSTPLVEATLKEDGIVTIIDYLQEDGVDYFKAALKSGLEGVMAKRLASTYQPGVRIRDWIKIKKQLT